MAKAVIIDLDGTIADTQKYHAQIESEILARHGVSITPEEVERRFAGMNLKQQFDIMLGTGKYDIDSVRAEKYFRLGALISHDLQPIPGAVELIVTLEHHGFPLAVGTAARTFYADMVLKSLGVKDSFRAVACGDMVKNGKPAPDIFWLAAKLLGVEPKDCVVIGDAEADAMAAYRAGMRCILLTPGASDPHKTARTVASLDDITFDMIGSDL